jgi:inorganic triphosphatase YgiF
MIPPREVELKLELDPVRSARPQARRGVGRLPGLKSGDRPRHLVSAIFDTADHALQKSGLVLRIRRDGERRIQTLKAERPGGGTLDRIEWECEVAGDAPDLAAIPDEDLREEVASAGALAPVLETEFDRTLWRVRRDGSDMELSLDEGTIRAGGRSVPISEIEIELKSGMPAALFEVAREIVGSVPARLGLRSKSERGYSLLNPPRSAKAEPFRVHRRMNVAVAFQVVVRTCLRQYYLNEPGIFSRDADALHRSRVAIRRLRSCLKLHKALIADEEGERLKRGLRDLSQELGDARNLDVYLGRIEGEGEDAGRLRARITSDREAAYDRLAARLRAKRNRLLLLDLVAYVETGEWLRDPGRRKLRETPVRRFAAKTLKKGWRRLRRDGRRLEERTPEERHEVRIEGKVLRYASEFFAGAFPKKTKGRREALLDALSDLQAHLGDLNDVETGAALAASVPTGGHGVVADPEREAALLAAARKAHKRIRKAEPFWG